MSSALFLNRGGMRNFNKTILDDDSVYRLRQHLSESLKSSDFGLNIIGGRNNNE